MLDRRNGKCMEMRMCTDLCDSSYQSAQSQEMKRKSAGFIGVFQHCLLWSCTLGSFLTGRRCSALAGSWWLSICPFSLLFLASVPKCSPTVPPIQRKWPVNESKDRAVWWWCTFFFLFLKARRPSILIIVVWQQFHSKCWKVCWGDSSYWLKL